MKRLVLLLAVVMAPAVVQAQERIALVIGVADYKTLAPLENTVNDANGIADTLETIGFGVTRLVNPGAADLRQAVDDFAFRSEVADLAPGYLVAGKT